MLTEINLNDGIIAINTASFANCSGIKTIHLPNITNISKSAFSGCSSLEGFIIGEDVTTISESAFAGCMSLKQINSEEDGAYIIPNSVTLIGEGAFSGCIGLKSITLPFVGASRTASEYDGLFGSIFGDDSYTGGTHIEQHHVQYHRSSFYIPSQLRSVTITDATKIYSWAFENCSMLTSLRINKAAKATVGKEAFKNCVSPKYY